MRYIRTPTGEMFSYDECEIFDEEDSCDEPGVFFNAESQESLAKILFENTGILVGGLEGGENTG